MPTALTYEMLIAVWRPDTKFVVGPAFANRRARKRHGRKYRATRGVLRLGRERVASAVRRRERERA